MTRRAGSGNDPHAWDCAGLQALEQVASVPAILKALHTGMAQGKDTMLRAKRGAITFADVAQAAEAGDPFVGSVLADTAQTLGWVCCQLNASFLTRKDHSRRAIGQPGRGVSASLAGDGGRVLFRKPARWPRSLSILN